jgi:uridine phosphorylase
MAPMITPEKIVQSALDRRGITLEDLDLAPLAVVAWHGRVVEALAEATGARRAEHWFYDDPYPHYRGEVAGQQVSFVALRVGAPATVMTMDNMIVCGVRAFIGIGLAGSLQRHAPVGTLIIPTECISEEGTSPHYVELGTPLVPSPHLAAALKEACRAEGATVLSGRHWTTDAPYRELSTKVEAYRSQGVLGVDMETSAMYAVGRLREVEVCNLLAVSDELWDEWRHAFVTPELRAAQDLAVRVVLRCIDSRCGFLPTANPKKLDP